MEVDNMHSEVKGTCPYAEVNLNARRDWFGTIVLWHDECLDLKQLHFIPGKKNFHPSQNQFVSGRETCQPLGLGKF